MTIRVKRVYDAPAKEDGERILVDRLWPRGMNKQSAALTDWMKDIAPSTELRKWFHSKEGDWAEFQERYLNELHHNPDVEALRRRADAGTVTLLYAVRDEEHNHAQILARFLAEKQKG
ncbi:DUF488 domain-containing protein [Shinella daejeonensis]|uniref:DUF488 domain-containing protein n=1 Tax=Shinella daejeonensis TaxID=659017 RepID=UPI0020C76E84